MKGNIENLLGGSFIATPNGTGEVEYKENSLPFDLPEKVVERTYDAEVLRRAMGESSRYREMTGRYNPFTMEKLMASAGTWSMLIERSVINFEDACDHAAALTHIWHTEDVENDEIASLRTQRRVEKEAAAQTAIMTEGTHEYEVEQARLAWRQAVAERDTIRAQMEEKVRIAREHYRKLRG